MTHAAARDWRASIQCYENATEMAKKLGVVDVLANILVSRATAEARGGDLDEADLFCRRSAALMEQLGDRLGLAEVHKVEGVICASRQQYEQATAKLSQGRTTFAELENHLGVAECERELGLLHRIQGDGEGSRRTWQNPSDCSAASAPTKMRNPSRRSCLTCRWNPRLAPPRTYRGDGRRDDIGRYADGTAAGALRDPRPLR